MSEEKRPVIVLTGPTAVGKTALSVALAKRVGGEILSADSMQVYRGMDIGSAKIREEEMDGVRHHLIDVLDPEEAFDVFTFQRLAKAAMEDIWAAGHIPLIVGGTGFYIQSVIYDIDFTDQETEPEYRAYLESLSTDELHGMLQACDPASAEAIHPNNRKRTIRAIEFYHATGGRISEHNQEQRVKESPYNFAYFVLNDDRRRVYERIDRRVDLMLEEGLEAEVRSLKDRGLTADMVSMQGLGYKEMLAYLNGEITSFDECVRLIKRNTRHFAKRQLTWFRRERDVIWVRRPEFGDSDEAMLAYMMDVLASRHIL